MESNTSESPTKATSNAVVEDVHRLKEGVSQLAADAKAHAEARVEDAKQRVNAAFAAAQAQLVSRPFTVLGIGIALGFLFGRRSRRHRAE